MTIHAPDPTGTPELPQTTKPVTGDEVIAGDRLLTPHGWSAEITHFDTPPPNSFACAMWGDGVRVPYHHDRPIAWPLPPAATVTVRRAASCG